MDRQRLADALAYEQERRRRLASVVPMPASGQPETASTPSLRSNLENLSIGLGEGLTNQLEGVRALVTDPIGTAKGTYEAVRGVVRDPGVIAQALREMGSKAVSGPLGAGEVVGEMLGPMRGRPAPDMLELDVYHGTPHRFPATETVNVYRGENAANMGGNYWSTDPEFAQQFTQRGSPEEVKRSTLSMSDVYSPPTPVFAGDAKAVDAAIAEARKLGKSAVRFSEGKGQPDSFFVIEKAALGRKGNPLGEFDASKIGTGEGAQAYGHGIYYAENPEVAKGYQPRDPKAEAKLMNLYKQAEARQNYDQMEVLEAAMLHRTASELREQYPDQKALINRIAKINEKATGSLYKADLPDEMIDRMLDWDKPLSEQPNVIKLVFDNNLQHSLYRIQSGKNVGKFTGSDLLGAVGEERLRQLGIPGIKYLDAGSRGQGGSGTRNFVVFPGEEKKVKILERK